MADTMDYQEFLNKVQKKGSKPYRIGHCYGARDSWKWVRKNKWKALKGEKCSSDLYSSVIKGVNKLLIEQLFTGHRVFLPHQMGNLILSATPAKLHEEGGKIKNNYRPDWKRTLENWYKDDAMFNERKCVKRVQEYIYKLHYSKNSANYRNQKYYHFIPCRSFVRSLGKKIDNQKLNALIY